MARKILLLADADSAHTRRWALALAERGFGIGIFSLRKSVAGWAKGISNIRIYDEHALSDDTFHSNVWSKLAYFRMTPKVKNAIAGFKPDVVHAHYATSYGLLGRKSGFHPLVISAWGSDVMDFPSKGRLMKNMLRKNFAAADALLATSPTIVKYMNAITGKKIIITPFGVDTSVFRPLEKERKREDGKIVIGLVKSLEPVYNVSVVIDTFGALLRNNPGRKIGLLIVGDGTQRKMLEEKVREMHIGEQVTFAGKVDHREVPLWHNRIDIFVNISAYESFGVSVLEAMACEVPVIVSDTGGLSDIVDEGVQGFRVPVNDIAATTLAMEKLVTDADLRMRMGKAGRLKVSEKYEWENNVGEMIDVYNSLL
ncbi:MAG TPA: glycosyltransferase [Bacteroidia bacterium]|nr:glycosyltransferase [Bacteroidia bacterium]